jgi:putative transposase
LNRENSQNPQTAHQGQARACPCGDSARGQSGWNYVNELSQRSIRERGKWLSAYDLQKYTAGFSKCDGVKVGSATVQLVCEEYATRRKQFKRARLNWRVSNPKSAKRSLGWMPFKKGGAVYRNGQVKFCGLAFRAESP